MENYFAGMKLTESQRTEGLVTWLNISQHYLRDIDEGDYKYEIVKAPELSMEIRQSNLRELRETECFAVINRGKVWYDNLTATQLQELDAWYKAWLDVTNTMVVPTAPGWLK